MVLHDLLAALGIIIGLVGIVLVLLRGLAMARVGRAQAWPSTKAALKAISHFNRH